MKIFITGVSSGIGKTLTIELIRLGHEVWGIARRQEELESLKKNLNSTHLYLSRCDIESFDDMKNVVGEMKSKNFIPDIVVLNAAVNLQNPKNNFDFNLYRKSFDINLYGALFWVREFLEEFLGRNKGQFIAISSTSAFRHGYGGISYSASKAALSLTFRRLRIHFAKTDLEFYTVYFGPIRTGLWRGPQIPVVVPSVDRAAKYIVKVFNKSGGEYYFPFFTTLLSRLSTFLPESLFILFSKHLTNKHGGD